MQFPFIHLIQRKEDSSGTVVKEITQHLETLNQFKQFDSEWADFLDWFKTIPLFLDLDRFRVVHACWDDEHIAFFKKHYEGITAEFLSYGNSKEDKSGCYTAINETLKGKEYKLPRGLFFTDKDGAKRTECRVRWWSDPITRLTLKDVLIDCPEELAQMK